jgi:hypothetical protein
MPFFATFAFFAVKDLDRKVRKGSRKDRKGTPSAFSSGLLY